MASGEGQGYPIRAEPLSWLIRAYQVADRAPLTAVIDAICRERRWTYTTRFEPTPMWEYALATPTNPLHSLLVVAHQDELWGWSELFPTTVEGEVELGIGLLPFARDHGIGTELLWHDLQWAQTHQIHTIRLTVRSDNARAIHLYKKFGFIIQREVLPPVQAPGHWWEMVCILSFKS